LYKYLTSKGFALDIPDRLARTGEMAIDYSAGFGSTGAGDERLLRASQGQHPVCYRCFDRILLNGLIQPFQQPERVIGFFDAYRHLYPVGRDVLRGATEQFQVWVKECPDRRGSKGSPR
jgi:hypothetical protein